MFSVGIVCKWIDGEWFAEADFLSCGFAKSDRVRIKIMSEFGSRDLLVPVNAVIKAGKDFPSLEWQHDASVFVEDNGENPDIELPEDWRVQLDSVIKAIGWHGGADVCEL